MRPSLHILSDRRRQRAAASPSRRTSGPVHGRSERPQEPAPQDATAPTPSDLQRHYADLDLEAQRAREAGGPLDRALYSCSCGYVFDAAVSTTVSCPHCGAEQAW